MLLLLLLLLLPRTLLINAYSKIHETIQRDSVYKSAQKIFLFEFFRNVEFLRLLEHRTVVITLQFHRISFLVIRTSCIREN